MNAKDLFKLLLDSVKKRIFILEEEVILSDDEYCYLGIAPGTELIDQIKMVLLSNVKSALHNCYIEYLKQIQVNMPSSFKQILQLHISILEQERMQALVHELFYQQEELNKIAGPDYIKYNSDDQVPEDVKLRMIALVYPYEFAYKLISNSDFFLYLLECISNYELCFHTKIISDLFTRISEFEHPPNSKYFISSGPLYFILAEQFLTFFVNQKMINYNWDPVENLSISQKCKSMMEEGIEALGLDPMKFYIDSKTYKVPICSIKIHPLEGKTRHLNNNLPENGDGLRHIVDELKKMSNQTSPISILSNLSNALIWITKGITINGNAAGADEIFTYFVFCLTRAEPPFLPGLLSFADTFLDEGLRETKFSYLITQLRCALDFITDHLLSVQPFMLFPFQPLPGFKFIQKLTLKGFQVYAFPTYVEISEKFPALLLYTGDEADSAIVYKYTPETAKSIISLISNIHYPETPIAEGTFLELNPNDIQKDEMIHIPDGDFKKNIADINSISILMKMIEVGENERNIKKIPSIIKRLKSQWPSIKNDSYKITLQLLIAHIQKNITILKQENAFNVITGTLNFKTLSIINEYSKGKFPINKKLMEIIEGVDHGFRY